MRAFAATRFSGINIIKIFDLCLRSDAAYNFFRSILYRLIYL